MTVTVTVFLVWAAVVSVPGLAKVVEPKQGGVYVKPKAVDDVERQYYTDETGDTMDYIWVTDETTKPAPPPTPPPTTPSTKAPTGGSGACECGVANPSRIVNGQEVSPAHKYPWHVGLKINGGSNFWCGGSIINERYVMTAAHCFFDEYGNRESDVGLVVGVADHDMSSSTDDVSGVTRLVPVEKVILFPKYNPKGYDYDIALLRLKNKLDLSSNKELRAVCLPKGDSKTYAGVTGTAVGWGRLVSGGAQPDKLQEVQLPILAPNCWNKGGITERMLCAGYKEGGKDTCQGDSGGPLYVKEGTKYVQVGITSHGAGCADPDSPGVYARVSKFLSWIKLTTADAASCS